MRLATWLLIPLMAFAVIGCEDEVVDIDTPNGGIAIEEDGEIDVDE